MMGWLCLLAAALGGYGLLEGVGLARGVRRAWLRVWLSGCLGAGLGLGLSSCWFVVLLWAGCTASVAVAAGNIGLAAAGWLLWRRRPARQASAPPPAGEAQAWLWILRAAGALTLVLVLANWAISTGASPHGDWDAFSIWNLRAKFLAGGQPSWRYAVSAHLGGGQLGAAHPDYPMLVSALVAELWVLGGHMEPQAPALVALLFALLTVGLLVGALGWLHHEAVGWVAALLLASSELFGSQVAAQYADLPLAFYMLAAVALLVASGREQSSGAPLMAAGALASLAAWTKNEGIVFLLLVMLWTAVRRGVRALLKLSLGAAPVLVVLGVFKLWLAPATVGLFPSSTSEALAKLADPARWAMIARAYLKTLWEIAPWWAHPLLLIPLWWWAAGLAEKRRLKEGWVLLLPAGMLAADFLVYLLTVADLRWHLDTSCNRLWLQVWPALLFGLFLIAGTWPVRPVAVIQRPRNPKARVPGSPGRRR